jgi:hypothetical protein
VANLFNNRFNDKQIACSALLAAEGKIQGFGSGGSRSSNALVVILVIYFHLALLLQGKIQGFGSGGPGEAARSSSGHYGGIGSSGSSGSGNYGGGFRSSGSSGLAAAQQAALQLSQAAQQALGDGPIAQGLASAANSLGGLLQPAGYGNRLNVSFGRVFICYLWYCSSFVAHWMWELWDPASERVAGEPIAQGLASAVNSLGGLLQPAGYGSRLNVSSGIEEAVFCCMSLVVSC